MDNMLYIIAGLVLIVLIAVLVIRKNKAQKPSAQPYVKSDRDTAAQTPAPKTSAPVQTDVSSENKFDPITIAQRFIDQQRYDKAIETLNRGLREKPNDSQLSLKLLSIYATINQSENFNKVYDTISSQNDPKSLALADELKMLFFEEQNQVAAQTAPVEQAADFESIDFDLPTTPASPTHDVATDDISESDASLTSSVETPALSEQVLADDNTDTDFALTLSDLEADLDEPALAAMPTTAADESTAATETTEETDFSEFDFGLEDIETAQPESSDVSTQADSVGADTNEALTLDEEDFVLDFDDLVTDMDSEDAADKASTTDHMTDATAQSRNDDFVLSLDDLDDADDLNVASETGLGIETESDLADLDVETNTDEPVLDLSDEISGELSDDSIDIDDLTLDSDFADSSDDATPTLTAASELTSSSPTSFDDNTLIDDDFDFDLDALSDESDTAASSAAPVAAQPAGSIEKDNAEDFLARFAADFDFVKSLDSNQVALDLAGQYLQLGEYDSAKRLLNEVISQGNSAQQQQAQSLLERTA
ncbi:FimV/HubP family polar landmark protein [Psychrobacter halodurans]|uniref:Pilus assembly protein FimV n=1 Tax=Psychrobacter halodurans TaxID=2818439 RepID=A0AAW4IJX3_9GAMM|nr:FimV/HubP family polar landmark protein [Psychrobacter halodurans]MBO1515808.1 pilus assembly protein FimV [Psychrobacter halodurans]